MKEPDKCENMDDIRLAINLIDKEIVRKIALRAKYVKAAAKYKKTENQVKDEKRVKAVIEPKKSLAKEFGVSPDLISNIYDMMINYFINEEMKEWKNR